MSYGTIPRFQLWQNKISAFWTRPLDNAEFALGIPPSEGNDLEVALWGRPSWDPNFSVVAYFLVASQDSDIVQAMMQSGGLWNSPPPEPGNTNTWAEIYAGATYNSTDGQQYTGTEGLSKALGDWTIQQTTEGCEQATDVAYLHNTLMVSLQSKIDAAVSAWVPPTQPSPPPPADIQWPPQAVGGIPLATTLVIAQGSRFILHGDPGDASRVVLDTIPIPTT